MVHENIQLEIIKGKSVYKFESHNFALCAWAEVKRNCSPALILITLDHHNDTQVAFKRFANDRCLGDGSKLESLITDRLSQINLRDEQSVSQAAADLWNDEQIDAAMRLKIFRAAFCFNQRNKSTASVKENHNTEPDWRLLIDDDFPKYPVRSDGIFEVAETYAIGRSESVQNGDWERQLADQAIESVMLEQLVSRANLLAGSICMGDIRDHPFVLDIDLDYFRTIGSLAPKDPAVFHGLIKSAKAISIATEPCFVRSLRLDQELAPDYSLKMVLQHIDSAQ